MDDFQTAVAATPGQVYAGRFTTGATSAADELVVRVPSVDEARTGVPVTWAPNGAALPAAGDRAWVMEALAEDGFGVEWIVVLWRAS